MPEFSVRVTPYEREGSTIKGLASINFGGLAVHNVSIHQGKENLYVSMPSYKTSQTDDRGKAIYKDICHPVTAKFRDKLYGAILQEYENAKEYASTKDSVLSKLNEKKDTAKKNEEKSGKNKGKEHDQPKRDEAQR